MSKTDIYRSFEQWKNGNVMEHGVPRTEHYSEAQLDLVEMGWKYGYDAGRAVEQALDKKAENARELGLRWDRSQTQGEEHMNDRDQLQTICLYIIYITIVMGFGLLVAFWIMA